MGHGPWELKPVGVFALSLDHIGAKVSMGELWQWSSDLMSEASKKTRSLTWYSGAGVLH